jgi:hypothetical protein
MKTKRKERRKVLGIAFFTTSVKRKRENVYYAELLVDMWNFMKNWLMDWADS